MSPDLRAFDFTRSHCRAAEENSLYDFCRRDFGYSIVGCRRMHFLVSSLLYYLTGSAIAGALMGGGFATNLSGLPSLREREALHRIGSYIPLQLEGIEGGLMAQPNEQRPTIVYVHGRSANRMEMAPLAEALYKEGYNAVLWDSRSRQISYGPKELDQIRRITAAIRIDPHVRPDRVYVIGFSLGGALAIGAAAQDADGHIRGVVADSPYADLKAVASRYVSAFGVIPPPIAWPAQTVTFATARALHGIEFDSRNPADWAARVTVPVLLIHGKSDKRIPPAHSEQILDRLSTEKELWLVDGAGHTQAFAIAPADYVRRVAAFLNRQK